MKKIVFLVLLLSLFSVQAAMAGTPKDTLVMASKIDDIITLDPAEIFEFSGAEYAANTYDRLINYDVDNVSDIYGGVAESWSISEDGLTYVFKIREGITFFSGNTLTADDVVFSLRRVVVLDKGPAFILTQFGFTQENMEDTIAKTGDYEVTIKIDKPYAPTFFLYCLTSTAGSVVDKKVVLSHEKDGDLGYAWLKTGYAGSGPYGLKTWKASESLILDRNEKYWGKSPSSSGCSSATSTSRPPSACFWKKGMWTSPGTFSPTTSRDWRATRTSRSAKRPRAPSGIWA